MLFFPLLFEPVHVCLGPHSDLKDLCHPDMLRGELNITQKYADRPVQVIYGIIPLQKGVIFLYCLLDKLLPV